MSSAGRARSGSGFSPSLGLVLKAIAHVWAQILKQIYIKAADSQWNTTSPVFKQWPSAAEFLGWGSYSQHHDPAFKDDPCGSRLLPCLWLSAFLTSHYSLT